MSVLCLLGRPWPRGSWWRHFPSYTRPLFNLHAIFRRKFKPLPIAAIIFLINRLNYVSVMTQNM